MENSLSLLTTAGLIWKANRSDHYPGFRLEPLDQDGTPDAKWRHRNIILDTTLQSVMNTKLSKHRFWHCHENGLYKTIQTLKWGSSQLPFSED